MFSRCTFPNMFCFRLTLLSGMSVSFRVRISETVFFQLTQLSGLSLLRVCVPQNVLFPAHAVIGGVQLFPGVHSWSVVSGSNYFLSCQALPEMSGIA